MNTRNICKILHAKLGNIKLAPMQVIFSLTSRCNSRCRTCGIWKQRPHRDISVGVVEQIVKLFEDYLVWVVLSGGEPSLYPDLEKVVQAILSAKVSSISIVSNGLIPQYWSNFIDQVSASFKATDSKLNISLSLDGIPEIHNNIRNVPNAFERTWDTLILLLELSSKLEWLNVAINYTVSSYNAGRFSEFLSFLRDKNTVHLIPRINLVLEQFSYYYGEHADNKENFYVARRKDIIKDVELYNRVVLVEKNKISSWMGKLSLTGERFFVNGIMKYLTNSNLLIPFCAAGRTTLYVDYLGKIYPCSQWDKVIGSATDSKVNIDYDTLAVVRNSILKGDCNGCWVPCEVFASWFYKFPLPAL